MLIVLFRKVTGDDITAKAKSTGKIDFYNKKMVWSTDSLEGEILYKYLEKTGNKVMFIHNDNFNEAPSTSRKTRYLCSPTKNKAKEKRRKLIFQ